MALRQLVKLVEIELLGLIIGPLCGEAMWGVLFIIEDLFLPLSSEDDNENENEKKEGVSIEEMKQRVYTKQQLQEVCGSVHAGSILSFMKQCCHQAYQQASARIVEPMYRCILQCSNEHLGKLYSVLNQRRGEIQNEDIWEGTDIFTITCILPVTESLGLANDLRQQTSGAVNHYNFRIGKFWTKIHFRNQRPKKKLKNGVIILLQGIVLNRLLIVFEKEKECRQMRRL